MCVFECECTRFFSGEPSDGRSLFRANRVRRIFSSLHKQYMCHTAVAIDFKKRRCAKRATTVVGSNDKIDTHMCETISNLGVVWVEWAVCG